MSKAVAKSKSKSVALVEETALMESAKIDRENGVIRDVKILGKESRNGRTYSDKALKESAEHYEGIGVNFDHPERDKPTRERRFSEGFGELRNVHRKPDGIYGDLHYSTKHALAEDFAERAEKLPRQLGLSHNAEGQMDRTGKIVESVTRVRSVDIVRSPATNTGLFESEEPQMSKKTLKQIIESVPKEHKLRAVLLEMDAEMPAMEVDVPAEASAEDGIKAAFRTAVVAAFDDDKLDTQATLGKIKEILKAYEKVNGSGEAEKPAEKPEGDEKPPEETKESIQEQAVFKQLTEDVAALKAKNEKLEAEAAVNAKRDVCRKLLESAGREVTDARITALVPVDDATRKILVEDWSPKQKASNRPLISAPLVESTAVKPEAIVDSKSFAAAITR